MAVVSGQGISFAYGNRRFEDYRSLKQCFQHSRRVDEVHICGNCKTDGAVKELSFCDNVINYIGAEGQVYIRTEQDDVATQGEKFVYIEYQDDTGAIQTILTADLDDTNTTTEVIVTGASDFYRLRRMYSEIESSANDAILLCDADWDGVADTYGEITDTTCDFALERFFTQPSSVCDSYLGIVYAKCASTGGAATDDTFFMEITYTPRASSWGAETGGASDITTHHEFEEELVCNPCVLLEGGTEVTFGIGDNASAGNLFIHAVLVEVYPDAR